MRKRIALIVIILGSMALQASAAEKEQTTDYLAMMLNSQKIGYIANTRSVADGKVTTTVKAVISIARGEVPLTITQIEKTVETVDGKPLSFESVTDMGFSRAVIAGTIDANGKMHLELTQAGKTTQRVVDYPQGALMSEGLDLETKRHGLKPGTQYKTSAFIPQFQSAAIATVTIGEKEKLDLFGRVVEGIKVGIVMELTRMTPTGPQKTEVPTTNYVTEDYQILRSDINVMGMTFTALQCDKSFALSPAKTTVDFLDALLLTAPKEIPSNAKRVTYLLKPKPGKEVTIPSTDSQKVTPGADGTIRVTVEPIDPPGGQKLPYDGKDVEALESLKPTSYVQSDDKEIVEAARKAIGAETDAAAAAKKISTWVYENIKTKTLSIGYASASEVLRASQGDCTEHSVLTAAMCRAVGIPARVAAGLTYVKQRAGKENAFLGHQWTQVYVGGKWVDLDATVPQVSRGAGSITLMTGSGEIDGFFAMLNNLGLFEIVDVEITR